MKNLEDIDVMIAEESHEVYINEILEIVNESAKISGTGIAKRSAEYIFSKIKEGKAIIALEGDRFAGFTYIESWGFKSYVATSGLIIHPDYRKIGLARRIKNASFKLARMRYPNAKLFSLASNDAVMKINTELGYYPVSFKQLTKDDAFWEGCKGCIDYPILRERNRNFCICNGMLYDPKEHKDDKDFFKI